MRDPAVVDRVRLTNVAKFGVSTPLIRSDVIEKSHSQDAQRRKHATEKSRGWHVTSRPEQRLGAALRTCFGDSVVQNVWLGGFCIDFYVESNKTYIQLDGVYWHGLDRPLAIIENSESPRDAAILKKFKRDRRADEWFKAQSLRLVRFTDTEIERMNDEELVSYVTDRLRRVE
jgi:very-short-patch-repair endonuclease